MLPASALLPTWANATSASSARVEDAAGRQSLVALVISHADHELPGDGFVEVDDVWVKQSNYAGVIVGDDVYYYCLAPHTCSCPACRDTVDPSEVEVLYRDESVAFPLCVYTLVTPKSAGAF
jgi:hypothetical protein